MRTKVWASCANLMKGACACPVLTMHDAHEGVGILHKPHEMKGACACPVLKMHGAHKGAFIVCMFSVIDAPVCGTHRTPWSSRTGPCRLQAARRSNRCRAAGSACAHACWLSMRASGSACVQLAQHARMLAGSACAHACWLSMCTCFLAQHVRMLAKERGNHGTTCPARTAVDGRRGGRGDATCSKCRGTACAQRAVTPFPCGCIQLPRGTRSMTVRAARRRTGAGPVGGLVRKGARGLGWVDVAATAALRAHEHHVRGLRVS